MYIAKGLIMKYFYVILLFICLLSLCSCTNEPNINYSVIQMEYELTQRAKSIYKCSFDKYMKLYFTQDLGGIEIAKKYLKVDEISQYKYTILSSCEKSSNPISYIAIILLSLTLCGSIGFIIYKYAY